jgi:putative transposase
MDLGLNNFIALSDGQAIQKPKFFKKREKRIAMWQTVIQMLSYKAESAGIEVITVDARDTAQECSDCHCIKRGKEGLNPEDRIYHCNRCGMQLDMDMNASINIPKRATFGQGGSHAQGESARPQQGTVLEELRTYADKIPDAGEAPSF